MAKYWRPSLVFPQSFQSVVTAHAKQFDIEEMDLMRNAIYAAVGAPVRPRLTPWEESLLGYFNLIAAKSPLIAKDLERLIHHISMECAVDAPDPIATADTALDLTGRAMGKTATTSKSKRGA